MQNKKLYIIIPLAVLIIAAAAFVGGRLLNGQAGALGFLPFGNGGMSSFTINMKPAPELPTTQPEADGSLIERQDNILMLQTYSLEVGSGGGVIVSSGAADSGTGESINVETGNDGPKVEVVITKETKIYRDATQFNLDAASSESQEIQQVVEPSSLLDELGKNAMLTVWGRKNGDRIIADVILYVNPITIQP